MIEDLATQMRAPLLTLALLPMAAFGATQTSCPPSLPAEAMNVHAPAGWKSSSSSEMPLSSAGMMAGPPGSFAYLVPYDQRKVKDGFVHTWIFPDRPEKWLYCRYDDSSSIQISKRLDDAATECTVRFTKSKYGGIESAVAECTAGKRR